jgi:ketosteroid isomerase-like protein
MKGFEGLTRMEIHRITGQQRNKLRSYSFTWFMVLAVVTMTGCGDGGNDSQLYFTSEYFPMSSAWETDHWTLFFDVEEYQINGFSTKAMVDTSKAEAYFWSNDENGLRIHGAWTPTSQISSFSQPIHIVGAFFQVGDEIRSVSEVNGEAVLFSVELLSEESVTTTAGVFEHCLKFRIHVSPVGQPAAHFGYETFWLARNVGFVKAQSDTNCYLPLFSHPGETRQLISYHLTPSDLPPEEIAVREAYRQWVAHWNHADMAGIEDMTHSDYYENCRNKVAALVNWNDFLVDIENYNLFIAIEDVILSGDDAFIVREYMDSYTDLSTGVPTNTWGRSTVRLKRTSGRWQIYGDQFDVYPSWASVYPRAVPGSTMFAAPVEITDCATGQWADSAEQIASIQLSGPPGSGIDHLELVGTWDPDAFWSGFWPANLTIDPNAQKGFYTFEFTDANGNYILMTDYLSTSAVLDMPVQISPSRNAAHVFSDVTFQWESVMGANGYLLEVYEVDENTGSRTARVLGSYTDQTSYSTILDPDKTYSWRVRSRYYDPKDGDRYDNESRCPYWNFSTSAN